MRVGHYFFKQLFTLYDGTKRFLKFQAKEKSHVFISLSTTDRRCLEQLPINILRRGPITYFSINFQQHKNFYNSYGEEIVDSFLILSKNLLCFLKMTRLRYKGTLK